MGYDFIVNNPAFRVIFGHGFSNYEEALIYSYSSIDAFRNGILSNSIVIYILSCGFFGLVLIGLLFGDFCKDVGLKIGDVAFVIALLCGYGTLIHYFIWQLIFLIGVARSDEKTI